MAARRERQLLKPGRKAPDFTLPSLEGDSHSLTRLLTAGPVLLAFFKVSCPVCQFALPYLERLQQPPASSGIRIVGISQDDARDTRDFLREFGCTFLTLIEDENTYESSNAYGLSHVPSILLVEPDGVISYSFAGWSKTDMDWIARRFAVPLFHPGEHVPVWKAG